MEPKTPSASESPHPAETPEKEGAAVLQELQDLVLEDVEDGDPQEQLEGGCCSCS